jgi:hypothetical protein
VAASETHLQMIQAVITRMANNSFLLKGWAVTLVAGLFALGAAGQDARLGFTALVPTFAFWCLDAYYLQQERLFRRVYNKARQPEANMQYDMNPRTVLSDQEREEKELAWHDSFQSDTEMGFYLPLFIVVLIASVLLVFFPLKPSSSDSKPEGQASAAAPATPGR